MPLVPLVPLYRFRVLYNCVASDVKTSQLITRSKYIITHVLFDTLCPPSLEASDTNTGIMENTCPTDSTPQSKLVNNNNNNNNSSICCCCCCCCCCCWCYCWCFFFFLLFCCFWCFCCFVVVVFFFFLLFMYVRLFSFLFVLI